MAYAVIAACLAGGALCAAGAWLSWRVLDAQRREALDLYRAATDRLVSAWREGVVIPAEPDPEPKTAQTAMRDDLVSDWLDQWDAAGREHYGRFADRLARQGQSPSQILVQLEKLRVAGEVVT